MTTSRTGRRTALLLALASCCALLSFSGPAAADEKRDSQWALKYLHAQRTWQQSTGKGVTVAAIDSGVDASHPDLKGQVLAGKGFGDSGDRFAREDADGHGTAMAGIVAGRGHGPGNADGVKGLAPGAEILPVRLPGSDDYASAAPYFAKAVRWSVDAGADVINMSFSWTGGSRQERRAVEYALKKDVVVVAAMRNDRIRSTNSFPASVPGVIATAGIGRDGRAWEKSEYGPPVVVAAPAEQIMSTRSTEPGNYAYADGNSDAAAYVSATAALVRAKHPDLTAGQVVNRIVATAKHPEGKTRDEHYGFGVINPYAALTANVPLGPPEGPFLKDKPSTGDLSDAQPADAGSDFKRVAVFGGLGVLLLGAIAAVTAWAVRRRRRAGM